MGSGAEDLCGRWRNESVLGWERVERDKDLPCKYPPSRHSQEVEAYNHIGIRYQICLIRTIQKIPRQILGSSLRPIRTLVLFPLHLWRCRRYHLPTEHLRSRNTQNADTERYRSEPRMEPCRQDRKGNVESRRGQDVLPRIDFGSDRRFPL